MRRERASLLAILALITIIILQSPSAGAIDNPIIVTYDEFFTTPTDYFPTCPVTVGITTYSAAHWYRVVIEREISPGTWQQEAILGIGMTPGTTHQFTYLCSETGWWRIRAGSVCTPFSIEPFFVIPEVPLGGITALAACLAGLGFKRIRYTRK